MEGWNQTMMKRVITRLVVFVIIFSGSLFYFNYSSTAGKTEMSAEMNQATLPVLYIQVEGQQLNEMHGYTGDMDESMLKDTLTPVEDSNSLSVFVKEYGNNVTNVQYELQNSSGNEVLEKGSIQKFKNTKGGVIANISWKEPLTQGEDYTLKLTLKPDGGVSAQYYTRLRCGTEQYLSEYLKFINYFHEATFKLEKADEELKQYMEIRQEEANNSLNAVNIHSSMEALTFAKLNPEREGNLQIRVKEMEDGIASFETYYILSAENNKKQTEYYYVTEYYRIKYGTERMYLLDFERKQEAFFNPKAIDSGKNAFKIGIASSADMQVVTNSDLKKMAMVRQRQLWYYDYKTVTMTKVFSFRQDDAVEARNDYNQHDIKIIRMSEEGEIIFAVYGYMNRGRHEGTCGIALYRFTPEDSVIEELLYVPSKSTYSALKDEVEQVLYYNEQGEFFFLMDGRIHQINCETKEDTVIAKEVTAVSAVTSGDGSILALQKQPKPAKNTKIVLWNLETGKKKAINAEKGTRLKNIGFVGQKLLYGIANYSDIQDKDSEDAFFPMYVIKMCDQKMKQTITYKKNNLYVTKAEIDGQALELTRVKKTSSGYEEVTSDIMIRKEETQGSGLLFSFGYSSERYNQLYLVYPNHIYITQAPSVLNTREMIVDDYRTINITSGSAGVQKYYVYVNGQIQSSYAKAGDAIKVAAEKVGDVIGSRQQYIWQSGETPSYGGFAPEMETISSRNVKDSRNACMAMILQYEGIEADYTDLVVENQSIDSMLSRYLGKRSVNLSGCTLGQVLYYVGKGSPVIAKIEEDHYILITSYNSTHIRYTDPVIGQSIKEERKKIEQQLSSKVFYSYTKQ